MAVLLCPASRTQRKPLRFENWPSPWVYPLPTVSSSASVGAAGAATGLAVHGGVSAVCAEAAPAIAMAAPPTRLAKTSVLCLRMMCSAVCARRARPSRRIAHAGATRAETSVYLRRVEPRVAQCLLIASVLAADGMITPEERVFLNAALARFELGPEERAIVDDLERLDEAEAVVAALSDAERRDFVDLLLTAASADGRLSPLEAVAVQHIVRALGID